MYTVARTLSILAVWASLVGSAAYADEPVSPPSEGTKPPESEGETGVCLRIAACQCWQGCVRAIKEPGPIRLRPGGPLVEGNWYRLVDGEHAGSHLMWSPVCLLDESERCFSALDMPVCTGSCYPQAPGYVCEEDGPSCVRIDAPEDAPGDWRRPAKP